MKEGIWQIILAILAIIIIVIGVFLFPKISEAGESFNGNIRNIFNGFFPTQEQKDARDKFENYFVDFKDEVYKECVDSSEMNCWCTKDMFELTNGFDLRIRKEGEVLEFDFSEGVVNFDSYQFQNFDSCLITEHGDFNMGDLNDEGFRVSSLGDSGVLKFELKNPITVIKEPSHGGFGETLENVGYSPNSKTEFEKEVNLSLMFFKINNGNVCIIDKVRANEYKNLKEC